jgi:HEAT repeat protein
MNLADLFNDKSIQGKVKTEMLSKSLLSKEITISDLIAFAKTQKDSPKATCIEALEFLTKQQPGSLEKEHFAFIVESLKEKAPRLKWESAMVIANTAQLHQKALDKSIVNLLENTEHTGTVVRWSAALALGEILKLKTTFNKDLLPAVENILAVEEKNSIRKIYLVAIKKITSKPK